MSGLYLHIPFCKQACSYCDFYFVTRHHQQQEFVDALVEEIKSKKDTRFTEEVVQTVYLGGGTPSLLKPDQLEQIFQALETTFKLDNLECTMELNPDDVTSEYLSSIKSIGINRASMGVQSFDEDQLRNMHRAHNRQEAIKCLELLANEGFDSFSVDLIYGNPNQTDEMLFKDLEILTSFDPPHVSAYSLTIEEGTRLGKQVELGRIKPPNDEKVAIQFQIVQSTLEENGIDQYEVSNFSRAGWEAKHNSAYWNHQNYLGFGPAAHSFWWNESNLAAERWNNKRDLKTYLAEDWKQRNELEQLDLHTLAEERLMLGLRIKKGIHLHELQNRYQYSLSENQISYLRKKEVEHQFQINDSHLALSKTGLLIADLLILDLLTA